MTGFSTDYVNQIAINLRDRYKSGFPILKELIQNADDAGAKHLVFGFHPGHSADADHMLLAGPALWVLNDGKFKPSDQRAIRSFGLNAKAGDAGAIGKFGLGMKSVFHLCESFLYIASSSGLLYRDVLNPWKAEDDDCSKMHQQWEIFGDNDVECLAEVAKQQPELSQSDDWFLLWVPLRCRSHVPRESDRPVAAIIEHYPGDAPEPELDFFLDPGVDQRIGLILPLLKNLESVRFAGSATRSPFNVNLGLHQPKLRLDHVTDGRRMHGVVRDDRPAKEQLEFVARQYIAGNVSSFSDLRNAASWPSSMVLKLTGPREPMPDKAIAEAALMFAHANSRVGRVSMQWAVFLPADEKRFSYEALIPNSSKEYRIVLHGQFFVDAGRRGIAEMESIGSTVQPLPKGEPSQEVVIRHWNQELAQRVLLPEFLTTLADYVATTKLKDDEISELTKAILTCAAGGDAGGKVEFFRTFVSYICDRYSWVRKLQSDGAQWEIVEYQKVHLLALPPPLAGDSQRPWRALPGLASLSNCIFFDSQAPMLSAGHSDWQIQHIVTVLESVRPEILGSGTDLEYFATFLDQERNRYIQTADVQDVLVEQFRRLILSGRLSELRQHRSVFRRVFSVLKPDRIFALGPADQNSPKAVPERLLRRMLAPSTTALLIPRDLAPIGLEFSANSSDLRQWLEALTLSDSKVIQGQEPKDSELIATAESIIKGAGEEAEQIALLRRCSVLRILGASSADNSIETAMSLRDLTEAHADGRLFRVSDATKRLGSIPKLKAALPALKPFVLGAWVAKFVDAESEPNLARVPASNDVDSILRCVGSAGLAPQLGDLNARADLLSLVATAELKDPLVVRGVRYLLHGSPDHYFGEEALWKDPVGRNSPWVRLWRMIDQSPWRVLEDRLCGSIPDKCAKTLNVHAVDEFSVLDRLRDCSDFSRVDGSAFSREELDLLLGRIPDQQPWRQLPFHRDRRGGMDTLLASSYLGSEPELPKGFSAEIRFIERSYDTEHMRRQEAWIPDWTAAKAAEHVLSATNPVSHWRYLMNLLQSWPEVSDDAGPVWRETPWLPLTGGGAIALGSLLQIDQLDGNIQELARQCDYAYASPLDLSQEVREHPAFPHLSKQINSGDDALPILGQLMSASELLIGHSAGRSYRDLQQHISTLVQLDCLPAWAFLERAAIATSIDAVEQQLVPELSGQLGESVCHSVLARLANMNPNLGVQTVFENYLCEWRSSALPAVDLRRNLKRLRLLSRAGTWVPAEELVAGVQGIVDESALSDRQAVILSGLVTDNHALPVADIDPGKDDEADDGDNHLLSDLENYVEPLASSGIRQTVGALIGVFGKGVAALAKSWLEPIAYEDYLDKLNWRDPGFDEFAQRREWMGGKSLQEALSALSIRLHVEEGTHIRVKSLTGENRQVRLASLHKLKSLYILTDKWRGYGCRVHLHPAAALLERDLPDQRDVLMRTIESLLRDLYNQKHANLSEFFDLAGEADQVTLDVARRLILDGLPQSLRSLPGITKSRKLADALAKLDNARRAAASAKWARRASGDAEEQLQNAIDMLARLVEEDEGVQSIILDGIRARVGQNQYEFSSIPFELFQNADDAVVEMQSLQREDGRPEFSPESIGRFVLHTSDSTIRFMHWGRPINYAGRHSNYRPEFGNDLERMLMLAASAKDPEEGVTGKFGLGFKSLLLASRAPKVWSGDLSFDVVAGCLPRKWVASEEARQVRQYASDGAQKGLRGTLFELSLDEHGLVGQVVERFSGLAGLLPVFARQIVQIDVDRESHQWRPDSLSISRGHSVELGSVAIPVQSGKLRSGLMVIRANSGCVVLRSGISGIDLFDREAFVAVPAVWVTAPTRGTPARGFLINASFQIDTGRATLAQGQAATTSNSSLVETIAQEVAPVLVDLLAASQNKWGELASQIGFAGSLRPADFWQGLWSAFLGESPAEEAAHDVRLLDRFACTLFRQVVNLTGLIPNGFTDEQSGFVEVSKISLSLQSHYLSAVVPALRSWRLFIEEYPVESWCTETVSGWLGRARVEGCPEITELRIAEVVACFGAKRLSAEEVSALACVLRLWPSNLGEHNQWQRELSDIHLQTQSGSWVSAAAIIGRRPAEDAYLVQFAPDSIILNESYTALGVDFEFVDGFLPHRSLNLGSLASWCLAAESNAQQQAVVHWLSRNIYSQTIDLLKNRQSRGGWLFELTQESAALIRLSPEERLFLLSKLGIRRNEETGNELELYSGLSLEVIHDWWSERGSKWIQKFDERLWPSLEVKQALKAEPFDRNAWMTLFSLGVFRRYGRVNDEQHRGFLDFLHSRGWWQTICEVDPDLGADAWMGILRAYAEQRQTDTVFELWMDSFPRLYRVARWLDTYVHLFQSLDQRESEFAKFLLSPAADTSLSGSGIDAPTLSGILRLGQHLVIRELLRVQVLSSPVAQEMAFAPKSAVLELMNQLGFEGLQSSSDIFKVLVDELGDEEQACFSGAYDIPLQLIATDASARREAERWAEGRLDDTDYDGELES